jgi:DNA-binding CsgD family transcriptional regulator
MPEVGLAALLARRQADLINHQHRVEQGRAAIAVLLAANAGRHGREKAGVEEIHGIDAIRDRLVRLTTEIEFEVLAFAPGGSHSEGALAAGRPLDEDLLNRGVDMRSVYLDSARKDPTTLTHARWLSERGGQVRTTATLPLRMIIADRRCAMLPIDPERSKEGAVILHEPTAALALTALFEQTWATATPLGLPTPRDKDGLSGQERALLRLLAQGDTDETVARKLGISDRTVRRLIADLTTQLGARSRFQAGARAAEQGWLQPSGAPTTADSTPFQGEQ